MFDPKLRLEIYAGYVESECKLDTIEFIEK